MVMTEAMRDYLRRKGMEFQNIWYTRRYANPETSLRWFKKPVKRKGNMYSIGLFLQEFLRLPRKRLEGIQPHTSTIQD